MRNEPSMFGTGLRVGPRTGRCSAACRWTAVSIIFMPRSARASESAIVSRRTWILRGGRRNRPGSSVSPAAEKQISVAASKHGNALRRRSPRPPPGCSGLGATGGAGARRGPRGRSGRPPGGDWSCGRQAPPSSRRPTAGPALRPTASGSLIIGLRPGRAQRLAVGGGDRGAGQDLLAAAAADLDFRRQHRGEQFRFRGLLAELPAGPPPA